MFDAPNMKRSTEIARIFGSCFDFDPSILRELRDEIAAAKSTADEVKATADEAKKESGETKDAASDAEWDAVSAHDAFREQKPQTPQSLCRNNIPRVTTFDARFCATGSSTIPTAAHCSTDSNRVHTNQIVAICNSSAPSTGHVALLIDSNRDRLHLEV
jgi:hypothetical protein